MVHIMVDIETLGRRPGCKVLSIGAVVFDKNGLKDTVYVIIDRDNQGTLHEDPATLEWWQTQHDMLQDLESNNRSQRLDTALKQFNDFIAQSKLKYNDPNLCLWGNGPEFDNAILQVACAEMNIAPSWIHSDNRCYRTLKKMVPELKINRVGTLHNALDDANSQALHAIEILNRLNVWE